MFYVTIDNDEEDVYTNNHQHIKKTVWWLGIILFVGIAYIFFYSYYNPNNHEHTKTIELNNNANHLLIVGSNVTAKKDNALVIQDGEEQTMFLVTNRCDQLKSADTLDIEIAPSHKKKITIEDPYHKRFYVHTCCKDSVEGGLEIFANKPNANLRVITDENVKKVSTVFRTTHEEGNVVDFVFQCIAGLLTALIMCFFVGRFESMNFNTPGWILVVLYFYAVIQGFLVVLDSEFLKDNEFLLSAHDKITKLIFFIALMGKVVLYIYLQGLYNTRRLFNYFVITKFERRTNEEYWKEDWNNIGYKNKISEEFQ